MVATLKFLVADGPLCGFSILFFNFKVRTCHGDVISQPIPGKYVQHVNETHSTA